MKSSKSRVKLAGGRLVLDFLNTAGWSSTGQVIKEQLVCEADVRHWTDALEITHHIDDGRRHDLDALRNLRTELREIFTTATASYAHKSDAVLQLNGLICRSSDASLISQFSDRPWLVIDSPLVDVILASAKAILVDRREIERVKVCSGPNCGWFFIDESRNSIRKWCLMETCGNRAKARRHYASKAGSTSH